MDIWHKRELFRARFRRIMRFKLATILAHVGRLEELVSHEDHS